jgi:hypothetical protein
MLSTKEGRKTLENTYRIQVEVFEVHIVLNGHSLIAVQIKAEGLGRRPVPYTRHNSQEGKTNEQKEKSTYEQTSLQ